MHEQPSCNQENQDPDWKKGEIVWNGNHAKRNEHDICRFSSTVVFHQFGSDTSCRAQNHQNVMRVMQILAKC